MYAKTDPFLEGSLASQYYETRVQSVVNTSEEGSDRELVLDRFQKVLSEVTNTNHPIRGTVGGYQQRLQRTNPKAILPKAGTRIGSTGQYHVEV